MPMSNPAGSTGLPRRHSGTIGLGGSVRVGLNHRALAVEDEDGLIWFWIGRHSEYDRLIG